MLALVNVFRLSEAKALGAKLDSCLFSHFDSKETAQVFTILKI